MPRTASCGSSSSHLSPVPMNTDLPHKAVDLWRQGITLQEIADMLNSEGHRTATGAEYQATTVWRMISRVDPAASQNEDEGERQGASVQIPGTASSSPTSQPRPR